MSTVCEGQQAADPGREAPWAAGCDCNQGTKGGLDGKATHGKDLKEASVHGCWRCGRQGALVHAETPTGSSLKTSLCPKDLLRTSGASLVVRWLGICLQGTQVRSLAQEDPTYLGVTNPAHDSG